MLCTTSEQLEYILIRAGTTPLQLEVISPLQSGMLELIASRNHGIQSLTVSRPEDTPSIEALSEFNMGLLKHLEVNGVHSTEMQIKNLLDVAMKSNQEGFELTIALGQDAIRTFNHPIFLRVANLRIKGCK
jgi:hypothetical protein